jgi:glycosyltransferase involved in cell wall biosynthesis
VVTRLARSTIFALPCVTEAGGGMDNLPTVVLEAMAAALPVVSTSIAGVPEMVAEGVTGLLVPENQPGALADALERLCLDRALARSLGEAGRERAVRLFRIEESGQRLRALFQRCGL